MRLSLFAILLAGPAQAIDPSARWKFSITAMMPREQAMAVPLSMWTYLFLPSSSRYLMLSADSQSPIASEVARANRMKSGSKTIAIVGTNP